MAKKQTATAAGTGEKAFPTGNLAPHALASLVPGEMSDEEFAALCTSIKEDGLQNPIVLFEGQILDGRHRYQACKQMDVKGTFVEYKGKDPAAFVLDNNLHRRQLNSMQKALVGARMHLRKELPLTQKDAAARVGVGVATVALAVRLLQSDNTPLIKRTERGDTTRGEIDEVLYDRSAAAQAETVPEMADGEDDEAPGNVIELDKHPIAGKRARKGGSAETPASRVLQAFKGLSERERISFCELAMPWLKPAYEKATNAIAKHPGKPLGAPKPTATVKRNMRKAIKAAKAEDEKAKAAA